MPIPDYQSLMLPLLKFAADGNEHTSREAIELLAKEFNLTDTEKSELLPSGQQSVFNNRMGWAKSYLKQAGLIDSPKKAIFSITDLGLEVLKRNPEKIDRKYLLEFESFRNFISAKNPTQEETESERRALDIDLCNETNPEETIEYLVTDLQQQLSAELLEKIKTNSPSFFENLVASLLLKMGYGSSKQDILQNVGKSGDEGIDGIIKEDFLGLDKIYIQAKRWQGTVGRPEIQRFVGAIDNKTHKGVFITTSDFSKEARIYADSKPSIVLIDGKKLTELMIRYNLGVQVKYSYEIKKIDEDFFSDGI